MSRSERNTYFEKLVALKLRTGGEDDRRSVISIDDAIVYAEAVMLATELEIDEAVEDAAADSAGPAVPAPTTTTASTSQPDVPGSTMATDPARRSRRLMDGWFGPARGASPASDEAA
jgi:hypothetical protein